MEFKVTSIVPGLEQAPLIFETELKQSVKKIEDKLIADAVEQTPEDEGIARASFEATNIVEGFRALIEVTNNAAYFAVLENGRGINKPPPPSQEGSALFNWVVKHINPEKPAVISFLVARAIGKRGLPAHRPLGKSLKKNEGFIVTEVNSAIKRGIRKINGNGK